MDEYQRTLKKVEEPEEVETLAPQSNVYPYGERVGEWTRIQHKYT